MFQGNNFTHPLFNFSTVGVTCKIGEPRVVHGLAILIVSQGLAVWFCGTFDRAYTVTVCDKLLHLILGWAVTSFLRSHWDGTPLEGGSLVWLHHAHLLHCCRLEQSWAELLVCIPVHKHCCRHHMADWTVVLIGYYTTCWMRVAAEYHVACWVEMVAGYHAERWLREEAEYHARSWFGTAPVYYTAAWMVVDAEYCTVDLAKTAPRLDGCSMRELYDWLDG